ncbi:site-specific DNA-methyltransferase [Rhodococcus sp. R1101]|uniref:site-specific DNA-methyltransferase n=1 Tax=Rhodococcus sp. R1101 TaxID=1170698 RepID=UPI000301E2E6|nr:site-specific DNA-methyltransferase [Rhodococcus sp. R1101]
MTDGINEIPSTTPNLRTELAQRLQELMPEAICDGKVDVAKLTELLSDDAADSNERFGLFWPGKKRALRAAQEPTTATLQPDKANSKDWDTTKNVFIEGDNLEVLKILQKHYHGKIKMIYIDPPYNTGQDFVYPDNYKEGLETYLEWTNQVNKEGKRISTNSESEGRYHSNWLNMMYPRLKLARNLLAADGTIFASIDYNEGFHLRSLMNEVFGESNFVGEIYWESKTKSQNTSTSYNKLQPKAEVILVYTRRDKRRFNLVSTGSKQYPEGDEKGPFRLAEVEQMARDGVRGRGSMVFPILGIEPREGNQWKQGRDTIAAYEARGDLLELGGKPTLKIRPDDERGDVTKPFWGFFPKEIGTAESAKKDLKSLMGDHGFDTVKPVELIKRLVFHATSKGDLVLDFFAGSGTTGHAVMAQNVEDGGSRRFMLVQLPEPTEESSLARRAGFSTVADLTRSRLDHSRATVEAQLAERSADLDLGYRSFKLADTNFTKWRVASDVGADRLQQHLLELRDSAAGDATADSLLSELLLKQGYSLTEESVQRNVAGLMLHAVGGGLLLAYLDEHTKPTLGQLREVVDQEPARFVILEDAFQGDDELKTNLSQLCKSKGVELWTA